jgi:hypothetical protein
MYTAYGIVTLFERSWRPCSTWVEKNSESSLPTCVLHGHHYLSKKVMISYAVYIQFDLLRMSIILLETCRGL